MTRMLTDIPQTDDTKTTARLGAETHLAPIEDIVADITAGKMVVLVDDEDRDNEGDFGTSFTVSCDATADFGITTGISPSDRAATINLLASGRVASNFHRPGHGFPLMAREGGVLTRIGHTEAGSDLAAMAGFAPVKAIVEIIGDDGEMLRLPQLVEWCAERGIALSTIELLRIYRQEQVAAGVAITQRPDGSPLATPLTSVK
ncbi:3,4-dihydroxy-2-butanone-4-phosphate synthase [Auritidibacter ignavus]|uniref:3,4-dihydroxy-2-butanone-4-phosphate synthase n=1 Tax=Auritidibacter ignavus TaxID=678932 RepID=UPI00109C6DA9|nr:3,4-dihydroxy-2-butanone-4-phosphate synthase [Auritidibacter ignavus]